MATVSTSTKLPAFERFVAYRRFGGALAFTKDAADVLFVSNISGQFNLWRVPAEGGWPHQLTSFADETVRQVAVSPRDGTIVFNADPDGDEFTQLYLLDPAESWPDQITDAAEVQHFVTGGAFSPDGTKLAYCANARTPADVDVWVRDLETGETRHVFGEGMYAVAFDWSPDGTKLLAVDLRHNSDTSVHLVDVETGDARELTPHDDDVLYEPGPWASDGSGFYLITDEGREFRGLAFYDLAAGAYEWLETPDGDVEGVALSDDGRVLAWLVNVDGWEQLKLRDLDSGQDLPDPELPSGARPHLTGFRPPIALSPDGSHAAVILSSPRRPPEIWLAETETGDARAVTESRFGVPREEELLDVDLIEYPTFDGRDIPAWLYRPDVEGRLPVVLSIHGGPEAQELPLYHPLYQYLASRGIAVLATNIRGSTGYGKTYQRLVQRDWGGGDMQDWEHAVKWLHDQEWVGCGADRRLRRLVRRLRGAHLRHAAAGLLGGRRRHLRPLQPHHVREGRTADLAQDDEAVRGRSRGGRRAAAGAFAADVHREREDATARDPGRDGSTRREAGVRSARGEAPVAGPRGRVRRVRRRGPRLHEAAERSEVDEAVGRLARASLEALR